MIITMEYHTVWETRYGIIVLTIPTFQEWELC